MSALLLVVSLLTTPAGAQDNEQNSSEEAEQAKPSEGGLSLEGPYKTTPYAKPVVGAMIWDGAYGVSLGAEAGLKYQQKKPDPVFFGKSRVQGAYTFGAGISGYDVRLGSFFGPSTRWWACRPAPTSSTTSLWSISAMARPVCLPRPAWTFPSPACSTSGCSTPTRACRRVGTSAACAKTSTRSWASSAPTLARV